MDDNVQRALRKWPHVPHCYGWLALDSRGHWYLRDDATQAAGPFPQSKGSTLLHAGLVGFIGRNYGSDAQGRWFFQNGPQRVYVELEAAPWVWRLAFTSATVSSHTGASTAVESCWLDEAGWLYLLTPLGLGLVHSQDMYQAAHWVEEGRWQPQPVARAELPSRFGFVKSPLQEPAGSV